MMPNPQDVVFEPRLNHNFFGKAQRKSLTGKRKSDRKKAVKI
jgi:hypothetical protein